MSPVKYGRLFSQSSDVEVITCFAVFPGAIVKTPQPSAYELHVVLNFASTLVLLVTSIVILSFPS